MNQLMKQLDITPYNCVNYESNICDILHQTLVNRYSKVADWLITTRSNGNQLTELAIEMYYTEKGNTNCETSV